MKLMNYVIHGKIESYPKRSSLLPPFQTELLEEVYEYIPKAFKVQLTYENVLVRIPKNNEMDLYEYITNNKATYENNGDLIQVSIMENILKIYQVTNPMIMAISVVCYLIIMISFFRKKYRFQNYKQVILLNACLCIYLVRNLMVGYVAATAYKGAIHKCQYLAPSYPVQTIFSVLVIVFIIQMIIEHRKNRKEGGEV